MMLNYIRKFLFRCEECKTIIPVEFEDEDDIKKLQDDNVVLECTCGGCCKILRD